MALEQPHTLADMLRAFRRSAGVTQEELAERAGISARTVRNLETGDIQKPRRDTLVLLADALALDGANREAFLAATSSARPSFPAATGATTPALGPAESFPARFIPPLIGRAGELAQLDALLRRRNDGVLGTTALLLAGEPGIGKSRLLQESARRAGALGWAVLSGGCHRRSAQEPYAPFPAALASFLAARPLAQRRRDLAGCGWLVRLLPELLETEVVPAPAWQLPPQQERRLMFAAVRRFLANVAGPAGTLLALDDLQWAGEDSLDLLAYLVRGQDDPPGDGMGGTGPRPPLRLVGAYRDTELRLDAALALLVADLLHEGLAAHLPLAPLSEEEAAQLLAHALPDGRTGEAPLDVPPTKGGVADLADLGERERQRILAQAGGIPFYLISFALDARASESSGHSEPPAPATLTTSLLQRVAVLSPAAREALAVAAVAGRQIARTTLLRVSVDLGRARAETLDGLDEVVHARLLVELRDGTLAFAHDLIQETVADDLSRSRRAELHLRLAILLEHEPQAARRPAELAWHFVEGDEPERALPYALLAGDQASSARAHAEADQHYRSAIDLARRLGDQAREAEALEKLADVYWELGRFEPARDALQAAAEIQRAAGNLDRLVWDTAHMGRPDVMLGGTAIGLARLEALLTSLATGGGADAGGASVDDSARALQTEQGPADVEGSAPGMASTAGLQALTERSISLLSARTAARVYLSLATYLRDHGRPGEMSWAAERAAECARGAREHWIEVRALVRYAEALKRSNHPLEEVASPLERARTVAEATHDLEGFYMACARLGTMHFDRGAFTKGQRYMREASAAAEQFGMPDHLAQCLSRLAAMAFYAGIWQEAREYAERMLAMFRNPTSPIEVISCAWCELFRGKVALARGDVERAPAPLEAAIALADRVAEGDSRLRGHACLAEYEMACGRPSAAVANLEPLLAGFRRENADRYYTGAIDCLVVLAWAYLEQSELNRASQAATEGITWLRGQPEELASLIDALCVGAMVALRQGRRREGEEALDEALALARPMPYPYAEAKALYAYGQLHAQSGEIERARERYRAALAICDRLGEGLYRPHIERALADLE